MQLDQTPIHNQTRMSLNKVTLIRTGASDDQYLRPYTAGALDQSHMDQFAEAYNTNMVSPERLGSMASDLIRPDTQTRGRVMLPNDWDTPRLRFFIEVNLGGELGGIRQLVTGYTDHLGVSASGHVDPEMRFHINSIITLNDRQISDHRGVNTTQTVLNNASHLLTPIETMGQPQQSYIPGAPPPQHGWQSQGWQTPVETITMTPANVIGNIMSLSDIYRADDIDSANFGMPVGGTTYIDTRLTMRKQSAPEKVSRSYSLPSSYLTTTLKALSSAKESNGAHVHWDDGAYLESARGQVADASVFKDRFLNILREQTSYQQNRSFSWREISGTFPNIESVTEMFDKSRAEAERIPDSTRGQGERLDSSTPEAIAVSMIATAFPSIMLDSMITVMSIHLTNDTDDGQLVCTPMAAPSSFIKNKDPIPMLNKVIDGILQMAYSSLTNSGVLSIDLAANINVFGNSKVVISLSGGHPVTFFIPTYCDALNPPIMTTDKLNIDRISQTIHQLSDVV